MKRILIIGLIIFIISNHCFASQYLSNDELIESLLVQVSQKLSNELIKKIDVDKDETLTIVCTPDNDDSNMIKWKVIEYLIENGYTIYESPKKSIIIKLNVENIDIAYPKVWRENVIGTKQVKRDASITIHYLIKTANDEILGTGKVSHQQSNIIPYSILKEQHTGISGRKPKFKSKETNFWEPVLVSAIIGGLIYIFYAVDTE